MPMVNAVFNVSQFWVFYCGVESWEVRCLRRQPLLEWLRSTTHTTASCVYCKCCTYSGFSRSSVWPSATSSMERCRFTSIVFKLHVQSFWTLFWNMLIVSLVTSMFLGPPVAITQPRPLCFAAVSFFFLFLFSARSPRSLGRSSRNFATWSEMSAILKTWSKNWVSSPKKIGGQKTCFLRCDFGRLQSRISSKRNDIDNRKMALQTTISPVCADLIWWTLVHKWRKIGP